MGVKGGGEEVCLWGWLDGSFMVGVKCGADWGRWGRDYRCNQRMCCRFDLQVWSLRKWRRVCLGLFRGRVLGLPLFKSSLEDDVPRLSNAQ